MSLIVLYFLHSTSVLSFYIDVVLTLSMVSLVHNESIRTVNVIYDASFDSRVLFFYSHCQEDGYSHAALRQTENFYKLSFIFGYICLLHQLHTTCLSSPWQQNVLSACNMQSLSNLETSCNETMGGVSLVGIIGTWESQINASYTILWQTYSGNAFTWIDDLFTEMEPWSYALLKMQIPQLNINFINDLDIWQPYNCIT